MSLKKSENECIRKMRINNMKNNLNKIFIVMLMAVCHFSYAQEPEFITSEMHFNQVINNSVPFDDSPNAIVIIEFWSDWNKDNAFNDWEKLTGAKYYRVNLDLLSEEIVKEYNVHILPYIIIFNDGFAEQEYKGDLSFTLKESVENIQKRIDELIYESKF